MYDNSREPLELFNDFKEFHNKHFKEDGFNIYEGFKKALIGYHFIDIEVENFDTVRNGDLIKFDVYSCKIVGNDKKLFIRVDYDMECSNEEIFDCYIVTLEDVTIKQWVREE